MPPSSHDDAQISPPPSHTGVRERIKEMVIIGGLVTALSYPALWYQVFVAFPERLRAEFPAIDLETFLFTRIVGTLIMVLIAYGIGMFLGPRYGLPLWGDARKTVRALPYYALAALVGGVLIHFVWDSKAIALFPAFYPQDVRWAVSLVVQTAVFGEIVERLGMLTLFCGLLYRVRHGHALAIVLHAALAAIFIVSSNLEFAADGAATSPWVIVAGGLMTFGRALIAGWLRVRRGLLDAMVFTAALDIRLLVYAVMT